MDKSTTDDIQGQIPQVVRSLDELAREGARRMIEAALELEVEEYIQKLRHQRDENGHALVVRNGKARPRTVSLGAGPVELQAPRVDDPCEVDFAVGDRASGLRAGFCLLR